MGRPKHEESSNLTIKITTSVKERLDKLQDQSDASSLTEVIRRSLALYDILLNSLSKGEEILLRDKEGKETNVVVT